VSDANASHADHREPADLHELLASEIRRRRVAKGLTQGQLAARTAYSREYMGRAERPGAGFPSPEVVNAIDTVLEAGGELVTLYARAAAERHARRLLHKTGGNDSAALVSSGDVASQAGHREEQPADEAAEALSRMQWFIQVNVDDDVLDALAFAINDVVERYETDGPATLARKVRALRSLSHDYLKGHQHPKQRERLYLIAAKLAGLLGYMAVNLGRPSLGRTYCAEAFQLAAQINAKDVLAWIRGTESLAAYYSGAYQEALELARDGQRFAGGGPQAIRLALNGEARAHGKLQNLSGVHEAVARGFDLLSRAEPVDRVGIIPCISFDAYDKPRAAANAATAYLSAGCRDEVLEYARAAEVGVEVSDSDWSKALVRLDVASALVTGERPEVERSATLGLEALRRTDGNPIASVKKRAYELHQKLVPWGELHEVQEFRSDLVQWSRTNVMSMET
jgi:transcriptional regulator with XRE-family HTH domain